MINDYGRRSSIIVRTFELYGFGALFEKAIKVNKAR